MDSNTQQTKCVPDAHGDCSRWCDHPSHRSEQENEQENAALAEIHEALQDDHVSIRLPRTFGHGRGVQVYVKSRKIGPMILRSEGQTLADLLHMIGSLAEGEK